MRTMQILAVALFATLFAGCEAEIPQASPVAHAFRVSASQTQQAQQAQQEEPKDVEGEEGVEACYSDSNGGSWTFEADSIGDTSGTYTRRDANGDTTGTGTWSNDRNGDITYDSDGGGSGTMDSTPDGYDYEGTDDDGNPESGQLGYDC